MVKLDGVLSKRCNIPFGVPQGSVLGPTLFLIYINELCNINLLNAKIITFADDTVVIFNGSSWDEVKKLAEAGFSEIIKWLNSNLLTLNYTKTKYITFSTRNNTQPQNELNIKAHSCQDPSNCNCLVLSAVHSIKYLGIIVDRNLRWKEQIDTLGKRVRKLMCIFKKIRHVNDPSTVKLTYVALCQSVITYGIVSWGGADTTKLIILERAQRALLKVSLFKKFFYPTVRLYEEANVLTVRQLYIKCLLLRQHLLPRLDVSSTRVKHKVFRSARCRTVFAQGFSSFLGPHIYNKINKDVAISDCTRFHCKKILDLYLKQLDYEATEDLLTIVS